EDERLRLLLQEDRLLGALVADVHREAEVAAVERAAGQHLALGDELHLRMLALRREKPGLVDAVPDRPVVVAEEEPAAVLHGLPVPVLEPGARDLAVAVGDLDRRVVGQRIEPRRLRRRIVGLQRQGELLAVELHAGLHDLQLLGVERGHLLAAVRVLVVDEAVAVVVDAVAADLVRLRAVRCGAVRAGAVLARVDGAGVLVVAIRVGLAGHAAGRLDVATHAAVAGLDGAGVLVVAVGRRRARRATVDRRVGADAVVADVRGARVGVAAVRGGRARAAAVDRGVLAGARVAGVGRARVAVAAVLRARARLAAVDHAVLADARIADVGGAGVPVAAVGGRRARLAAVLRDVLAD